MTSKSYREPCVKIPRSGIQTTGLAVIYFGILAIGVAAMLGLAAMWALGERARTPSAVLISRYSTVGSLLFSADGKYLVTGTQTRSIDGKTPEGDLSVWEFGGPTKTASLTLPQQIQCMAFSKNSKELAVALGCGPSGSFPEAIAKKGREIRLFSFPDLQLLGKIESERVIHTMDFSPDGKLLAATRTPDDVGRAEVVVWDVATLKVKHTLKDFRHARPPVRFSPDGKTFVVSDFVNVRGNPVKESQGYVRVHDSETGKLEKKFDRIPDEENRARKIEFFPDGKKLLLSGLHALDLETGVETKLGSEKGRATQWAKHVLSADGKWVVTVKQPGLGSPRVPPRVFIFDTVANKMHDEWNFKMGISSEIVDVVALSRDKKTLAIGADQVYLFDVAGK